LFLFKNSLIEILINPLIEPLYMQDSNLLGASICYFLSVTL
jgi:hypothetical protein